jgi:hypothetical protein
VPYPTGFCWWMCSYMPEMSEGWWFNMGDECSQGCECDYPSDPCTSANDFEEITWPCFCS